MRNRNIRIRDWEKEIKKTYETKCPFQLRAYAKSLAKAGYRE